MSIKVNSDLMEAERRYERGFERGLERPRGDPILWYGFVFGKYLFTLLAITLALVGEPKAAFWFMLLSVSYIAAGFGFQRIARLDAPEPKKAVTERQAIAQAREAYATDVIGIEELERRVADAIR